MTRRTALALCCTGLLSIPALAGDEPKTPACCAKKAAKGATARPGKLRCFLTGKEVDKCCCVEREGGKLHCTLANKDVERCCCSDVKVEGREGK
jgi:hypothetical protein